MKQEDKDLLFKDLSTRLPYHVKVKIWLEDGTTEEGPLDLEHNYENVLQDAFYFGEIKNIKPYLRPMSSMTEEENNEWRDSWLGDLFEAASVVYPKSEEFLASSHSKSIDWLNKHHFDYNGLIPKGLALEAPEGMYKYKNIEYTNL